MKNSLYAIFLSVTFSAYYSIGDNINIEEHLNYPIEVCHGEGGNDVEETITLGQNIGKITVIGLEIPW